MEPVLVARMSGKDRTRGDPSRLSSRGSAPGANNSSPVTKRCGNGLEDQNSIIDSSSMLSPFKADPQINSVVVSSRDWTAPQANTPEKNTDGQTVALFDVNASHSYLEEGSRETVDCSSVQFISPLECVAPGDARPRDSYNSPQ